MAFLHALQPPRWSTDAATPLIARFTHTLVPRQYPRTLPSLHSHHPTADHLPTIKGPLTPRALPPFPARSGGLLEQFSVRGKSALDSEKGESISKNRKGKKVERREGVSSIDTHFGSEIVLHEGYWGSFLLEWRCRNYKSAADLDMMRVAG